MYIPEYVSDNSIMNEKSISNRGRKSKYDFYVKPRLEELATWLKSGMTEAQCWKNLGISVETANQYKRKHPEFLEVVKNSREVANNTVISSLYKLCTGYESQDEVITITEVDGKIRKHKAINKRTHKPEVAAIIFWLTNRCKDNWQNRLNSNINSNVNVKSSFADIVKEFHVKHNGKNGEKQEKQSNANEPE